MLGLQWLILRLLELASVSARSILEYLFPQHSNVEYRKKGTVINDHMFRKCSIAPINIAHRPKFVMCALGIKFDFPMV